MADAPPSFNGLAVDPPAKVKKKEPRKPRSECTPEEIAKLDAELAKRREWRAVIKVNAAAAKFTAQCDELEATRRKAAADEKEDLINKAHAILMLGMGRPAGFPAAEAQKKRKSIRMGSYTQDEDKLICQAWMEISQDPRTGAQQKGIVLWMRVHKIFHERKMFEPCQITSNRGIVSIQKRWFFIQQVCNKYCATFESVEAQPVSGLGVGDMDQYRELQRKRGLKTAKFVGGGDGEALKRPRGKTNSKDVRDEKKRQSKEEQMKQYLDLQTKKLEMEKASKRRKIDMEEAARQRQLDIEADNIKARKRQLDIEATNAATKAKEVALAIMSVDLSKMSDKTRAWFEAKQKEMLDAEGLN
ncbi:hypothetical protein VPH35_121441 [Triticum aestivum]